MNQRSTIVLFAFLLAAAAWWIWDTTGAVSGPVASQFGSGGRPNNFMSGETYRWFMLAFTVALPILVAWAVGGLPRLAPNLTNIPNRERWLAPPRREETLRFMSNHGVRFGLLLTLFGCAIHWLVLKANARRPPRLDMEMFWIFMAAFIIATGLWALVLVRRFREPPRT